MFFVRFIPNAARRRCRHVCVLWCTVKELPVHHIYARTHSWRSSFKTCHFVNIYIPTVHRLYDQHLNKTLSLVYICSQVTDATIALAKKEKPIKTLFLRLTGEFWGELHDCDIQLPFHKYESLFNILICIIKFVVAVQNAYDLNVFAKMYRETGENCDYKAIPDSVSSRL